MTNKEASTILRALWAYKEPRYTEKEIREALSLAIKQLEAEPTMEWTHDAMETRKTILTKIDFLIAGITSGSSREIDLMIAQTVQALSEAYKNLEEKK